MSELLFESYQVPSLGYGIDSLFSFYANGPERSDDGIVVSAGHHFTHVIPVSNGKAHMEHAKRYVFHAMAEGPVYVLDWPLTPNAMCFIDYHMEANQRASTC
jgi:hypothetical protein